MEALQPQKHEIGQTGLWIQFMYIHMQWHMFLLANIYQLKIKMSMPYDEDDHFRPKVANNSVEIRLWAISRISVFFYVPEYKLDKHVFIQDRPGFILLIHTKGSLRQKPNTTLRMPIIVSTW